MPLDNVPVDIIRAFSTSSKTIPPVVSQCPGPIVFTGIPHSFPCPPSFCSYSLPATPVPWPIPLQTCGKMIDFLYAKRWHCPQVSFHGFYTSKTRMLCLTRGRYRFSFPAFVLLPYFFSRAASCSAATKHLLSDWHHIRTASMLRAYVRHAVHGVACQSVLQKIVSAALAHAQSLKK